MTWPFLVLWSNYWLCKDRISGNPTSLLCRPAVLEQYPISGQNPWSMGTGVDRICPWLVFAMEGARRRTYRMIDELWHYLQGSYNAGMKRDFIGHFGFLVLGQESKEAFTKSRGSGRQEEIMYLVPSWRPLRIQKLPPVSCLAVSVMSGKMLLNWSNWLCSREMTSRERGCFPKMPKDDYQRKGNVRYSSQQREVNESWRTGSKFPAGIIIKQIARTWSSLHDVWKLQNFPPPTTNICHWEYSPDSQWLSGPMSLPPVHFPSSMHPFLFLCGISTDGTIYDPKPWCFYVSIQWPHVYSISPCGHSGSNQSQSSLLWCSPRGALCFCLLSLGHHRWEIFFFVMA